MSEVVTGVNREMDWNKLLGSVTKALDPELWLRTAYRLAEHRLLRQRESHAESSTLPEVDDATATWLVAEAGRRGISVERVAGLLLRCGVEWERRRAALPAYHDLDALAGTWSEDEAA